jgi:putative glutamine amidotransferase
MRPIIGITVDCLPDPKDERTRGKLQLNWNYAQAVADAGGIPLLIPPQAASPEVARLLDGLLIPGGNDFDASLWGETTHPKATLVAEERIRGERTLYDSSPPDLPILGVCYGCQFLNVMRGGSLIQHLPDLVGHDQHSGGTLQDYVVETDSKLGSIVESKCVRGQSWHHQAVDRLGEGMRVAARSDDGTVEAIEAEDRPWMLGVQWHPERTMEDGGTQRLFAGLVEAARNFRERTRPGG